MGLGKILVVGSVALAQVWDRVEPEAVDPEVEPVPHDLDHRHEHARIVEVEVRLMREEAVPVIGPAAGSQVQFDFSVSLKMMRVPAYFWSVSLQTYQLRASDVGLLRRARSNQGCSIRGVVDDELDDHPELSASGLLHETPEILHGAEIGIDVAIVRMS